LIKELIKQVSRNYPWPKSACSLLIFVVRWTGFFLCWKKN